MIKNLNELKATQQKLTEFQNSLKKLDEYNGDIDSIQVQIQKDSIKSFIEEFENEIREFENLKRGDACYISLNDIHKLHEVLIKARIAFRMSQEELAKKIGTSQQQLQRWESGNYESITWSTMLDVIDTLGINISCNHINIRQPKFILSEQYSDNSITNAIEKVRVRKSLLLIGEN